MNKRLTSISLIAVIIALFAGCIKNDIPYPRIPQNILTLVAVGEEGPATISTQDMHVTVRLSEEVDIHAVKFTEFTYTEGAESSVDLLDGTYDLSTPIKVILSKYQSYEWIISAQQTIEHYFTIAGQIGSTVIDDVGHRIIVYVPDNLDKSALTVSTIKLGPANNTTISPAINAGETYNFAHPIHLTVTAFGRSEDWTIYVDTTEAVVTTTQVDAWTNVIWAYGAAPDDAVNGFQYRRADSAEWIDVPRSEISSSAGTFSTCIKHLSPLTDYVVRAVSDDNIGNEISVRTEASQLLPDGSFDQWWLNGRVWNPWDEFGVRFWDTGNTGAATLGQSNVVPSDDTPSGSGKAAKLETKFVGIAGIGKLAAGSIYTGEFARVDGTNGILNFGRPWTLRPTKLKGYYSYTTAPINYASTELKHLMGRPDSCHIYIALTEWNEPYEIRTNPKNQHLFDKNSPEIIAYGELICGENTNGYKPFEIKLNYRATNKVPRYIQVTAAASKYGDFFTGGTGAVLYVDQFELDYDY